MYMLVPMTDISDIALQCATELGIAPEKWLETFKKKLQEASSPESSNSSVTLSEVQCALSKGNQEGGSSIDSIKTTGDDHEFRLIKDRTDHGSSQRTQEVQKREDMLLGDQDNEAVGRSSLPKQETFGASRSNTKVENDGDQATETDPRQAPFEVDCQVLGREEILRDNSKHDCRMTNSSNTSVFSRPDNEKENLIHAADMESSLPKEQLAHEKEYASDNKFIRFISSSEIAVENIDVYNEPIQQSSQVTEEKISKESGNEFINANSSIHNSTGPVGCNDVSDMTNEEVPPSDILAKPVRGVNTMTKDKADPKNVNFYNDEGFTKRSKARNTARKSAGSKKKYPSLPNYEKFVDRCKSSTARVLITPLEIDTKLRNTLNKKRLAEEGMEAPNNKTIKREDYGSPRKTVQEPLNSNDGDVNFIEGGLQAFPSHIDKVHLPKENQKQHVFIGDEVEKESNSNNSYHHSENDVHRSGNPEEQQLKCLSVCAEMPLDKDRLEIRYKVDDLIKADSVSGSETPMAASLKGSKAVSLDTKEEDASVKVKQSCTKYELLLEKAKWVQRTRDRRAVSPSAHEKKNPYQLSKTRTRRCPKCGKSFVNETWFLKHILRHSHEKPGPQKSDVYNIKDISQHFERASCKEYDDCEEDILDKANSDNYDMTKMDNIGEQEEPNQICGCSYSSKDANAGVKFPKDLTKSSELTNNRDNVISEVSIFYCHESIQDVESITSIAHELGGEHFISGHDEVSPTKSLTICDENIRSTYSELKVSSDTSNQGNLIKSDSGTHNIQSNTGELINNSLINTASGLGENEEETYDHKNDNVKDKPESANDYSECLSWSKATALSVQHQETAVISNNSKLNSDEQGTRQHIETANGLHDKSTNHHQGASPINVSLKKEKVESIALHPQQRRGKCMRKCSTCNKKFKYYAVFEKHMKLHQHEMGGSPLEEQNRKIHDNWRPGQCTQMSHNAIYDDEKNQSNHNANISSSGDPTNTSSHVVNLNELSNVNCETNTSKKTNVIAHLFCKICNIKCRNESKLKYHQIMHQDMDAFIAKHGTVEDLTFSKSRRRVGGRFPCRVCDRILNKKLELSRHLSKHRIMLKKILSYQKNLQSNTSSRKQNDTFPNHNASNSENNDTEQRMPFQDNIIHSLEPDIPCQQNPSFPSKEQNRRIHGDLINAQQYTENFSEIATIDKNEISPFSDTCYTEPSSVKKIPLFEEDKNYTLGKCVQMSHNSIYNDEKNQSKQNANISTNGIPVNTSDHVVSLDELLNDNCDKNKSKKTNVIAHLFCKICNLNCRNERKLKDHQMMHQDMDAFIAKHGTLEDLTISKSRRRVGGGFACRVCDRILNKKLELSLHLSKHRILLKKMLAYHKNIQSKAFARKQNDTSPNQNTSNSENNDTDQRRPFQDNINQSLKPEMPFPLTSLPDDNSRDDIKLDKESRPRFCSRSESPYKTSSQADVTQNNQSQDCLNNGKSFKELDIKEQSVADVSKQNGGKYTCSTCSREFVYFGAFKKHVRLHSSENSKGKDHASKIIQPPKTQEQSSDISSRLYSSSIELTAFTSPSSNLICLECSSEFVCSDALQEHIIYAHKPYKCHQCGFNNRSSMELKYHLQTKHPESSPKLQCTVCHERVFTAKELIIHYRSHQTKQESGSRITSKNSITSAKSNQPNAAATNDQQSMCLTSDSNSYNKSAAIKTGMYYDNRMIREANKLGADKREVSSSVDNLARLSTRKQLSVKEDNLNYMYDSNSETLDMESLSKASVSQSQEITIHPINVSDSSVVSMNHSKEDSGLSSLSESDSNTAQHIPDSCQFPIPSLTSDESNIHESSNTSFKVEKANRSSESCDRAIDPLCKALKMSIWPCTRCSKAFTSQEDCAMHVMRRHHSPR